MWETEGAALLNLKSVRHRSDIVFFLPTTFVQQRSGPRCAVWHSIAGAHGESLDPPPLAHGRGEHRLSGNMCAFVDLKLRVSESAGDSLV